jgi:Glycoside hydrolase family 44
MRRRWLTLGIGALFAVAAVTGLAWRIRKMRGLRRLLTIEAPVATVRIPQPLEPGEVLYDGKLQPGWDDWGWGAHELGKGSAKIAFTSYGGILFHHPQLPSKYGGVSFRYKAPQAWGEFMHVTLLWSGVGEDAFPVVNVEPRHVAVVDGWREVLIPWRELNPDGRPFDRVRIGSRSLVGAEPVLLERVILTKEAATAAAAAASKAELRVLCGEPTHPISPLIYGNSTDAWGSGQSAKRIGGNPLSRLNWDLGFYNVGKDWFFENAANKQNNFDVLANEAKDKRFLAMVVPMLGWVAKDGTSVGFPRSRFASQQHFDPYKAEAGDGFASDGSRLAPGDPSQTSVPAPPELIGQWVRKLVARGPRSVSMYILDNEPALWNSTHRDVHPNPLSYDELLDRTIKYASAIRSADPEAVIAGPAEWGWPAYFTSALDSASNGKADRNAHGGEALIPWYLKQLALREKATGTRLLNVLDLHFYPQAQGVFADGGAAKDPVTAEMRLRSTRALWDPTYFDESWIKEAVRLIPRMKEWVRQSYPGTLVSLGEWSFGAEDHISGGLATAEALGRFGQQGLDSAFHWGDLKEGTPGYWAFRAFRNYDGKGARFQDLSVPASESEQVSLFASRDADARTLVLVLINRSAETTIDTRAVLNGCGEVTASRLFSYAEQSTAMTEGKATLTKGAVGVALPPYSISVVELKLEAEKR